MFLKSHLYLNVHDFLKNYFYIISNSLLEHLDNKINGEIDLLLLVVIYWYMSRTYNENVFK